MRQLVRILLSFAFMSVGITHFTNPEPFVQMMPAYLPFHLELVYISGACEIAGGFGLMLPSTRKWAAYGLLLLLFAVFPANINMAVHEIYLFGMPEEPWLLWARLPLQLVIAALVWWAALAGRRRSPTKEP